MAAITIEQARDLARWAFGPDAGATEVSTAAPENRYLVALHASNGPYFYGPSWGKAFERAGWKFPPPPRDSFIQLGSSVIRANDKLDVCKASSNTWARKIAEALNRDPDSITRTVRSPRGR